MRIGVDFHVPLNVTNCQQEALLIGANLARKYQYVYYVSLAEKTVQIRVDFHVPINVTKLSARGCSDWF